MLVAAGGKVFLHGEPAAARRFGRGGGFGERRSWRWRCLRRRRPGLRRKKSQINAPIATRAKAPVMMKKSAHPGGILPTAGSAASMMFK